MNLQELKEALLRSQNKDTSAARSELEKALSEIGSTAVEKKVLPEAEYEKKTYDAPTDEQLSAQAEAALTEYKQLSEQAIAAEAEKTAETKTAEIEKEKKSGEETAAKIAKSYAEAVQDFENDALKRGVARSSIAVNNSAALRSEAAAAQSEAAAELNGKLRALESEIAQLEVSRQTALDSFNIAYAAKLTEKISGLAAERDKKQAEVLEYNNAIAEKELEAAYDKAALESDLYSEALSQADKEKDLNATVSDGVYQAKYSVITDYLNKLSAADAKQAVLNDTLIRGSLSDYYYYKLYNAYAK